MLPATARRAYQKFVNRKEERKRTSSKSTRATTGLSSGYRHRIQRERLREDTERATRLEVLVLQGTRVGVERADGGGRLLVGRPVLLVSRCSITREDSQLDTLGSTASSTYGMFSACWCAEPWTETEEGATSHNKA